MTLYLHVARAAEMRRIVSLRTPIRRITRPNCPHFVPTGFLRLRVLDGLGCALSRPVLPCEWLHAETRRLALCRNPYPTGAGDRWLLCNAEGTACFAAATPEMARIQFYFLTGRLATAHPN